MKKIAILSCLNSNKVCAGCACLTAFNRRIRSFAPYQGEELELTAFMRCSSCVKEGDPMEDAGFREKLERLVQEGTEILHIGICAGKTEDEGCPGMRKMAAAFRDKGVQVVWGTHGK